MLRKVLLVMGGTLASRVLGLVRQAVFNALYPDALKDAFNVAYRVPNLFRELLAEGAVQNALIPLLKGLPPQEAQAFARRFAAFLLGVNLLVLGLGYLLAPWVAGLLVAEGSHLRTLRPSPRWFTSPGFSFPSSWASPWPPSFRPSSRRRSAFCLTP